METMRIMLPPMSAAWRIVASGGGGAVHGRSTRHGSGVAVGASWRVSPAVARVHQIAARPQAAQPSILQRRRLRALAGVSGRRWWW